MAPAQLLTPNRTFPFRRVRHGPAALCLCGQTVSLVSTAISTIIISGRMTDMGRQPQTRPLSLQTWLPRRGRYARRHVAGRGGGR